MQVSLVHICLATVTEYFGTPMNHRIRRTLPIMFLFSGILILHYLFLTTVLGV